MRTEINPNFDDLKGYYSLHLAKLPLDEGILAFIFDTFMFDTFLEMHGFLVKLLNDKKDDRVYLYSYGGLENPIIISCNFHHILNVHSNNAGFTEHHIHEYSSYKEAYEIATEMMEEHPLCYNKPPITPHSRPSQSPN
ncbi:MAG: hypothetical protein ACKO96_30410 [Flammeovirgaceae bacterium]